LGARADRSTHSFAKSANEGAPGVSKRPDDQYREEQCDAEPYSTYQPNYQQEWRFITFKFRVRLLCPAQDNIGSGNAQDCEAEERHCEKNAR
jgi:hypothetical protein